MCISLLLRMSRPLLRAQTCQELICIKVMASDVANPETVSSIDDKLQIPPSVLSKEWILKEYSDVFEGLGCMDGQYHMEVDEAVWPVVYLTRKVPVAPRGIITTVTEPTKWVSSLVLVNKLRICINPQDLDKALLRVHYPLLTIEEVATRLSKAKVFSILDAKIGTGRYNWKKSNLISQPLIHPLAVFVGCSCHLV